MRIPTTETKKFILGSHWDVSSSTVGNTKQFFSSSFFLFPMKNHFSNILLCVCVPIHIFPLKIWLKAAATATRSGYTKEKGVYFVNFCLLRLFVYYREKFFVVFRLDIFLYFIISKPLNLPLGYFVWSFDGMHNQPFFTDDLEWTFVDDPRLCEA